MAKRRVKRHLNPKLKPYLYGLLVFALFCTFFKIGRNYREAKRQEAIAIEKADLAMLEKAKTTRIHYQWKYSRLFRDMNDVQLAAAQKLGFSPLSSPDEEPSKRVRHIESCEYYKIDKLTHSSPFLVPKAADLLEDIGRNFADSLERRFGIVGICPIVTSVTRTRNDVKKLRRSGNVNASENSCHFYGTTFDITYSRFYKHTGHTATFESAMMKQILAEVLKNLKDEGRCYVKYERKQACFHITARP